MSVIKWEPADKKEVDARVSPPKPKPAPKKESDE